MYNEEGLVDTTNPSGDAPVELEEPAEAIKPKIKPDPRLPSRAEIEEHNVSHLPYRNWCPVCIKAKGKDMDHRPMGDKDRRVAEYCFDYCFPGDELGFKWTVLVGKERLSRMRFATAVPTKGSSGKFAVDKSLEFLEENGDSNNRII